MMLTNLTQRCCTVIRARKQCSHNRLIASQNVLQKLVLNIRSAAALLPRAQLSTVVHSTSDSSKSSSTGSSSGATKVCIIGSGPAGFYTAIKLLKNDSSVYVDIYEKLAVPYGLVRYGVAPDHPEVKNCISAFSAAANKERCNFYGNISVGSDITVPELRQHYHAVVLASGAWGDRKLGIPGEADHVVSARRLVGWYNGLPQDSGLQPPLYDAQHAVIIGQGNVALDVARILLTPVDKLRKLDIPEHVLEQLSRSRVTRVTLVGRRAPQHAAFTIKELREMTKLEGVALTINREDCHQLTKLIPNAGRARRRLLELLLSIGEQPVKAVTGRHCVMKFLRSPTAVTGTKDGRATSITLALNRLEDDRAVATNDTEVLPCDLVLRSIGYVGTRFDSSLPYTEHNGTISNTNGRVTGMEGVYATGWAGSGPIGVIASTMTDSFTCAQTLLADLAASTQEPKQGSDAVLQLLRDRGVHVVSQAAASRIMQVEEERGAAAGKLREKITSHDAMLNVAAATDA
uniref:NADPH:adrenodoxin oxidoreductase, mitochondrial n=1 Tax=Hirondellea gigas TaxID=1518452 RepID=A0A2P2HWP4_9CRUS